MRLKLKTSNSRFFIPRAARSDAKLHLEDFYDIKIKYKGKTASFIIYLGGADERVRIPKGIALQLGLKRRGEILLMAASRIVRPPKPASFLHGNCIDILYFIPHMTYSRLPVICRGCMKNKARRLECWYSSKGRPNELVVERFISTDFLRLCGYYQAEGAKLKLRSRQGRSFQFSNSAETIIRNVIERLHELGLTSDSISLYARYNPHKKRSMLGRVKRLASELKLSDGRVRANPALRIANVVYNIVVTSSIFGETVMNAMDYFRRRFAKRIRRSETNLCYKFLQGLFDGDGSLFVFRDKSLHIRIMLYEGNRDYANDYSKILNNLGISNKITKDSSKNPYKLHINGSWKTISKFLKGNVFALNEKKQATFLNAIRQHERFSTLEPLRCFINSKEISTMEIRAKTGWKYGWVSSWLKRRRREGVVRFLRKRKINGTVTNIWGLGKQGKEELETLLGVEEELKRFHPA